MGAVVLHEGNVNWVDYSLGWGSLRAACHRVVIQIVSNVLVRWLACTCGIKRLLGAFLYKFRVVAICFASHHLQMKLETDFSIMQVLDLGWRRLLKNVTHVVFGDSKLLRLLKVHLLLSLLFGV